MTFMHKLSARLARLKALIFLTALVATACERPVLTTPGGDPITQLVVLPQNLTLHPSQTADLMAVAFTSSGDTGSISVSWSVTGGSIIQTSTSGKRHYGRFQAGSQPGMAKVVAEAGTVALADTAVVAVTPVPVASVTVAPAVVSVLVGTSVQLAAVAKDSAGSVLSGRAVTWASSAPAVANVNSAGLVTGAAAGSATITATSEGKNGTSAITVTTVAAPVASVDVTPATASVVLGATVALTATLRDAAGNVLVGRVVTWSSSAPAIASVNGNGVVTGVTTGPATITATSEGRSGAAVVTVTGEPVAWVEVTPATAPIAVGRTLQLTAVAKDLDGVILPGRAMSWSSSSVQIATVAAGLVTGVAAGTARIVATSEGMSDTATITVTVVPVASVTVTPAAAALDLGETVQLTATARDAGGNTLPGRVVTWASSNAGVATVSASGLVTARAAGSATITATSEGQSGTAAVTVTLAPVASVGVSPASASVKVGWTIQLAASVKDAAGKVLNGRTVTWSSSNPAVAAVSGTGMVTGVAEGSATITATSEGHSGTGTVTVTPPSAPGPNILGIDLLALPRSGAAYQRIVALAARSAQLDLADNTGPGNDVLLARAILGDKAGVLSLIRSANNRNTVGGMVPMGPARNLTAWAIALNLVNAHEEDAWLIDARDRPYGGFGPLICNGLACRANNHGAAADQSLVAIDLHLGDIAHLETHVLPSVEQRLGIARGMPFRFGSSCQPDPNNQVVIGLPNTFCDGVNVDGLLLEEQRRAAGFPNCGNYNFGAAGQLLISTYLLEVAGYQIHSLNQRAFHRVFERLIALGCQPSGDDVWQGYMYNAFAGVRLLPEGVGDGKSFCCTDYLFVGAVIPAPRR